MIYRLSEQPDDYSFPPVQLALQDPDGLLAVGGDLSPKRLIAAYQKGIFPWYNEDQPILWWSPDPRCIIHPDAIHVSRSLAKTLRKDNFKLSFDKDFSAVIKACAATRKNQDGTWINADMLLAYSKLHQQGIAHSIEVWQQNTLVGGLYGLAIGQVFFGESMFSRVNDASKIAFICLGELLKSWDFTLIDCQVESPHLLSLGASCISRDEFINIISTSCCKQSHNNSWQQPAI